MQAHPYHNLHWYPLTSSKSIWPEISVAYFTKWFQYIFTVGGWRMYPFNLPLLPPAYIHTQSCKRASFWSLNPARTRLKSDIYFWSPSKAQNPYLPRELRYVQRWSNKNVVCRCGCRYTFFRTENSNHLDQNIGIMWHKRSMLVNDNTAEYRPNVSQEKMKLSRNYL